jgi:HPt (histidine-containing phosphotransfer) domain-containing protein
MPPIQINELLERVSGNREFAVEMLDLFFKSSNDRLSLIQKGFDNRNYVELAEQAHKLKGLVGNLSINMAFGLLKDLYQSAVNQDDEQIKKLLPEVSKSIAEAKDFFNQNPSLIE